MGKKEQEQREAHNKALHMPDVDQCPVIVIKQILCLLTANLQRLGFSTLLVNMRCDLFWLPGGGGLQHPEGFCTDKVRTFTMRRDASEQHPVCAV